MDVKVQIAVFKQNIQKKQIGKAQEEIDRGIIDEEEFQFIKQLKGFKQQYKNVSAEMRKKKLFIKELDQEIRRVTHRFLTFSTNTCSSPGSTSGSRLDTGRMYRMKQ